MKKYLANWLASVSRGHRVPRCPERARPCLEALEDRLPPAAVGGGGGAGKVSMNDIALNAPLEDASVPTATPRLVLDPGPGPGPQPTGHEGVFVAQFRAAAAFVPADQVWWLQCPNIQRVCEDKLVLVNGEPKTIDVNCIWVCTETNEVAIPGRPPLPFDPPGVPVPLP